MNDGNDKHEGAWWGNLETLKPSQVQSDYSYVDEDDRRKKFIIIAAVIGIVLVLLLGGVTAFTVLSSNKGHDSDTKKEQTQTQKIETSTENAKKKKSAEKSAISVMVTADGAAEDSKASVSVSEKGKNGKIVVKDISVAVNDEVKICTLPKGKYLLTVESAPDGYDKPAKSTSFTVKGDGKKVSAFYKSWDLENLPWNLNDFAWKKGILSGCKDIISGLKDELKEADCVVIATDVDPSGEGELLAWEALEKCGWRGPTKRMYFADEAPASVQKAFMERKTLPSILQNGSIFRCTTGDTSSVSLL